MPTSPATRETPADDSFRRSYKPVPGAHDEMLGANGELRPHWQTFFQALQAVGPAEFARPCHGLRLPGSRFLPLYAVDLGRSPDGSIHILKDRTQAPSGAGYALENRIVLSRMLPDVFRDCQVQRLALFFRAVRDTLRG